MAVTVPRRRPKNPEGRMPLRAHLYELRRRLLVSLAAILVGGVLGWMYLYEPVVAHLREPLVAISNGPGNRTAALNFTDVLGSFNLRVKISAYLGLMVTSPIWLYQMWAFVVPGLTRREKWYGIGFVAAAVPLFGGGIALAWFWLPRAVELLTEFTPEGSWNVVDAEKYFAFTTRLLLAFGIAFVLPLFLVALNFVGVLPGSALVKHWRIAVFVIFLFAAIVSPSPDPGGMLALALPMVGLYLIAMGVCLLNDRRRNRSRGDHEIFDLADDESSPLSRSDFTADSADGFNPRVDDDAT